MATPGAVEPVRRATRYPLRAKASNRNLQGSLRISVTSFGPATLCLLAGCALSSAAVAQQAAKRAQPPTRDSITAGAIISDEEFDAAIPPLPPLDADIDAPLPTLADWQREADARDAAQPAAGQLADDPALQEPLVPLAEADIEPLAEATDGDDATERALTYRIRLTGLEQIPAVPDGTDIAGRFRDLSVLEDGDGKAANGAVINARLREDQQLLSDLLSGQGFYDAVVDATIEPAADSSGLLTVVLTVTPGKRYALGSIDFAGARVVPDDLIKSNFALNTGDPILAERVLAAEANLAVILPENGYPFAEIGQRDVLLDAENMTGDYTLPVDPGPLSSFGAIRAEGNLAFGAEHVAVLARFREGEKYDRRLVDDLREALVATSLFSLVSVEPVRSGRTAADGTELADLVVRQEAGPPRTIAASAGYATGEGIRGEVSWTHRNLFPPEGALIVNAIGGTRQQGAGVTFRRANAGRRDRTVELAVSADHTDFDAYEAYTARIAGRMSYSSTPIWQKRFTWSAGFELLGTSEEDYDFNLARRDRSTFWIAALPGQIGFDTSDDLLDPTSGFRINFKLSPEASLGSGAQFYARTVLDGSAYYPVGDSIVIAGRARVGSIVGAKRTKLAPSRRLYAGGGGSVRGFGYQELGPKDPDNDPIGGRGLVEGALEGRYRFGNYGVAAFVDAGQVSRASTPSLSDIRFGAGLGGRFYTNFGPVRIDVATPIGRRPGESRVSVYVSIGQAF